MARPTKLTQELEVDRPDGTGKETTTTGEAICRMVALGVYPGNAAQAHGVSRSTLHNWRTRASEWMDKDRSEIPEEQRPFVEFLDALTRAEARGLAWHELNVRRAAGEQREAGGRLSLEFLARRMPQVYSRRVEIDTQPGDRGPAPIDLATAAEVEEAFDAAFVPEGIDASDLLPTVPEDGTAEQEAASSNGDVGGT